jgi:hypothetical protein
LSCASSAGSSPSRQASGAKIAGIVVQRGAQFVRLGRDDREAPLSIRRPSTGPVAVDFGVYAVLVHSETD